jgi:hypothetical protein
VPAPNRGYSEHLRSAVASSAAPYGYTLTIWTSGAVAMHDLGSPNAGRVLLFLAGAVGGFLAAGVLAHGSPRSQLGERKSESVRVWGGIHIVPIAAAVGFTSLVCTVINGAGAWIVIGFAGTLIYLLGLAAQFTIADSRAEDG